MVHPFILESLLVPHARSQPPPVGKVAAAVPPFGASPVRQPYKSVRQRSSSACGLIVQISANFKVRSAEKAIHRCQTPFFSGKRQAHQSNSCSSSSNFSLAVRCTSSMFSAPTSASSAWQCNTLQPAEMSQQSIFAFWLDQFSKRCSER